MSPELRKKYFAMWQDACAAKGWRAADQDKRRSVTLDCMQAVRGPLVSTSDPKFGPDEITAMLCYLDHLAHPACLDRAARWVDCRTDYRAYNRARQADWHQGKVYGSGANKLTRERFAGETRAVGEPLEPFDPEKIRKRHLTMATRHQAKQRKERANLPRKSEQDFGAKPEQDLAGQNLASPEPAYVPPSDQPF